MFYIVYKDGNNLKLIPFSSAGFKDITMIDVLTSKYTKEEFISSCDVDLTNKDILIIKVIYHKKDKYYDVKIYDVIFKTIENYDKIILQFQNVALNRLQKVNSKERKLELDYTDTFKELSSSLLNKGLNNPDTKYQITRKDSIVNHKLKEFIGKIRTDNDFTYYIHSMQNILTSYMELRGLLVETLNLSSQNVFYYDNPYNYHFPSLVFGYNYDFDITLYEANQDVDKKIVPTINDLHEKDLLNHSYLTSIYNEPFSNPLIYEYYRRGGKEAVFANLDMDEIYSSSDKDLLKLGVISEEDYLTKHPYSRKMK